MKRFTFVILLSMTTLCYASNVYADMSLARSKNCMSCHAVDRKLLGPAYKDVAAKYAADKNALAKLATKVIEGGSGVWGVVPMPANPQVSEAEARKLVAWILEQK